MAYGLTIDQVRKTNRPTPQRTQWGSIASLTDMVEYAMYRVDIVAGGAQPLHFHPGRYQAFVETGEVIVRTLDSSGRESAGSISAGETLALPKFLLHGFASPQGATIYLFGPRTSETLDAINAETAEAAAAALDALNHKVLPHVGQPTTDVREKYWGRIESIVSDD